MDDNDFNLSEGYTPDDIPASLPYRPPRNVDVEYDQTSRQTTFVPQPDETQTQPTHPADNSAKRPKTSPRAEVKNQAEEQTKRKDKPAQKPKKVKKQRDPNRPLWIVRFFTDERTRIFLGITLLLTSILVVIAVFSHFSKGAEDQSIVLNLPLSETAQKPSIIGNSAGGFGAALSHWLLCDALGLGSLVLIVYMWILGLALLGIRKCKFWGTTFRALLVAITISIVLGLVTYSNDSVIYWGGNHGHYVNKFIMSYTTWLGAVAVSILLVTAVCCVYLNELRKLWKRWSEAAARRRERLRQERERLLEIARRKKEEEEQKEDYEFEDDPEEAQPESSKPETQKLKPLVSPLADALKSLAEMVKGEDNPEDRETVYDPAAADIVSAPQVVGGAAEPPANVEVVETDDPNFKIFVSEIDMMQASDKQDDDNGLYDHRADLSHYRFPTADLLEDRPSGPVIDIEEQKANKERIVKTLLDYKIPISSIEATVGPTVTLYEIVPAEGVRISQIKRLEDDIALSLSALGIRIIAPIPGKGTVGIEVPNNDPRTVSFRSIINSRKFQECKMSLPMAMGATISNDIFIADLAKMPHLLVAGATGMGKSVGLNVIIASLLYKKHPSELKFVLVDPKMVEFSLYSRLERHYLAKLPNQDAIITDMKNVVPTLNSLCVEMDNRYDLLRQANVRSLEEYNKKFTERRLLPKDGHRYLPFIVVVVDEFADLIMTQGREVETPIGRIAQKARAVGIHMILATQRPSTNVITGLIKANFPGRIAFRVIQMVDSRTILDCPGANQLIGRGDMLFSNNGIMERVQCAFISTSEVEDLTKFIDDQVGYPEAYLLPEYVPEDVEGGAIAGASTDRDALFNEAARFVVSRNMGSTSSLQRQFGIGYNRAGKLMDQMEAAGIVGPINGSKPRNILMDIVTLESILGD